MDSSYGRFQDDIFRELQDLEDRQRSIMFGRFVADVARCGITLDELIEMTHGCRDGGEFLELVEQAAIGRGALVTGGTE